MLTVAVNSQNSKTVAFPPEELETLGIAEGDEIEFSRNEKGEIILRNVTGDERKRRIESAKNKIMDEWHDVFVALAKGEDDEDESKPNPRTQI